MKILSKTYISEVEALIPLKDKTEKKYLKNLQTNVEEYIVETGADSLKDLYSKFGTPKEVISYYYSTVDTEMIIQKTDILSTIKVFIAILIFFILCFSLSAYIYDTHFIELITQQDNVFYTYWNNQ